MPGVSETWFQKGNQSISLIDVGGQRSERKKWLHCFDSVSAIVFVAALSAYDQTLGEGGVNSMIESLNLYQSICSMRWFKKTTIILFLNKKDVLDEKIGYSPLTVCFTNYQGSQNKKEVSAFIAEEFCMRSCNRHVYQHFTCAKDPSNLRMVFDSVVDIIFYQNVDELGML